MRIAVIHDSYQPIKEGSVGGEDNLVNLELRELKNSGHEVSSLIHDKEGVKNLVDRFRALTYGSPTELIKKIHEFNPEVIHCHNLSFYSGTKWMDQVNVPIVYSLHNFRIYCPIAISWRSGSHCFDCRDKSVFQSIKNKCSYSYGSLRFLRDNIFQKNMPERNSVSRYIAASELMKIELSKIINEDLISILPNPSPDNFETFSKVRSNWLFAGRLTREKGILELIQYWPDSQILDIAGDGELKDEVLQIISNKPNIRFIGTYSPSNKSIYANYLGLVFPSLWMEGSPLVILESFAVGTPVICLSNSSACELIQKTEGGFVINAPLNENNLKFALNDVYKNFQKYSGNALKCAKENFSIKGWIKSLESIFSESISAYRH